MRVLARILSTSGAMTVAALSATPASAQSNAYVTQISEIRPGGAALSTVVRQQGDGNTLSVTQAATGNVAAQIGQNGERNRASVTQTGSTAALADIGQSGARNDAALRQGTGVNVAIVRQLGDGNRLDAGQIGYATGGTNSMVVAQLGDDNVANVDQAGSGNALNLLQGGNKTADITQNGNSTLTVNQLGARQDSIMVDMGANMSMTIDRYAGAAASRGGK